MLKPAWRFIKRHKVYSSINILGLAMSIAACLIIFLVVKYELGYDRFHKKADRIYRVTLNAIDFNPSVSMGIAPAMRNDFPELEAVSRVWYWDDALVTIGDAKFNTEKVLFADKDFTKIFDYKWLAGDPVTALAEPNSMVLTKTQAQTFFGNSNPMGQYVKLVNAFTVKVTGLIDDVPGNTHLSFNSLVSLETVREDIQRMEGHFYAIPHGGFTYILVPENFSVQQLQQRIKPFIEKNWGKSIADGARLPLQPLTDIHFDQRYLQNGINITTSRTTYSALMAVALFIIIIACINFINLSTAQAIKRAREIGVRKVLGSNRLQLVKQFLGETAVMIGASLCLALLFSFLVLPVAARWLGLDMGTRDLFSPSLLLLSGAIAIVMVFLAGLYPAFVQSAFQPVQTLKQKALQPAKRFTLRKTLVVAQFAITQIMIIGTLVVAYQVDFLKNKDLGFDQQAVISIRLPDPAKQEVLKQEVAALPGVKGMSMSSGAPAYNSSYAPFSAPELGITKDDVVELKFVDEQYTDLFKLNMLSGEKVHRVNEKDSVWQAVVNETLMHKLNITDPQSAINTRLNLAGQPAVITGVVQDFQSESRHQKRRACALLYSTRENILCVKLQTGNMQQTIASIGKEWSALYPQDLFSYEFLDEHIAKWYKQEQKQYTAFKMFSVIAILIGCLGLYGLIAFAAAQRTKEVGIRKVLGASLTNIVSLFSKEFVWLIVIAFVIAAPVAWYTMNNWLQNFAYQVNISAGIFGIAILASLAIAGCTIAYQVLKAARANPVKSLRTE